MKEKLEFKVIVLIFLLLTAGIIVAGIASVRLEKEDVDAVSKDRLITTTKVISKSIEGTMLEANSDFTKTLLAELKTVSGYQLDVFNAEGREAFNKKAAPVKDDPMLEKVLANGEDVVSVQDKTLTAYIPLSNRKACQGCHRTDNPVMGVVKVAISLEKEHERITSFGILILLGSFFGVLLVGGVLWMLLRYYFIKPLKTLESSAVRMAGGDLSFRTLIASSDELGRLDRAIKDSLISISGILKRVRDISRRISATSEAVEDISGKVVENTMVESEAVAEISSSVEELNAAITEIADSTGSLARHVQDTAASMEEMTVTISSLTNLTHEVSEGVDTTTSSLHQFSATIKEVEDNANDLYRVSDETMSAVEEIINSIKEVESRAKESAALSRKVAEDAATLGMASIEKTMHGMENIRANVSRTAEVIQKLGGRSEEIGSILNVIDDITDQTTLLALNAAILAAQAGEHGKGFSVVANEIKDLAERTALSTQEIDNLIKSVRQEVMDAVVAMDDGITSVEQGMKLSKDASSALREILSSSKKSADMSSHIERTTAEQSKTSKYVIEAIERVRHMVEQIVKATAEQSKGVSQIMNAAEMIRDAARQADNATDQQATGSKQIARAIDSISEMSNQISRAINEQKSGARQIWASIEKIKNIPETNQEQASQINKALSELKRDSDLANMEMERFTLYKEKDLGMVGFGVVPFEAPAVLYRKFSPLVDYLSRKTGIRFDLRVASDFDAALDDMRNGVTSACFMTTMVYLEAHRDFGAKVLAKTLIDGRQGHRSVIVAREHGNIKSVADLKGKAMGFVDRKSTSGYMVPLYLMDRAGLALGDLSSHVFLGYHMDVVRAVLRGDVDAGGVMESVLAEFSDEGLVVVAKSEEIPSFNVCVSPELGADQAAAIETALFELGPGNPVTAELLGRLGPHYSAISRAEDMDFEAVRKMASELGMF